LFERKDEPLGGLLRKFSQEDVAASSIRSALALAGPLGGIVGEFLTEFIPGQRADRLHDFVEKLNERLQGLEEEFKTRLASSVPYAALTEHASLSAVRTPSDEHRRDLAAILQHGLSRDDAEMLEQQALLVLRDQINDAQVLILMSYGNFQRTMGDTELDNFQKLHSSVFAVQQPSMASSPEERRRWTMYEHYRMHLEGLNLLEATDTRTGSRRFKITPLGKLLLDAVGRFRDPFRKG
jgi:hypothetical protein